MIARVVTKRDDVRLAMGAALVASLSLLLVLADDVWGKTLFQPAGPNSYVFVAVMMALGAIAPWLAWTRRGRAVQVTCAKGMVRAGKLRIAVGDVSALSLASGARGRSVAITHGKKLTFLEVERDEDATKMAETLVLKDVPFAAHGAPAVSRVLALPQAVVSLTALALAQLYYIAATNGFHDAPLMFMDAKALFGVGGVVATQISLVVLFVRWLAKGQAVALRKGAWDAHVVLHRAQGGASGAATASPELKARTFSLSRGDENVRAWLTRLDAMPTEQHAYRGDAMKKDVLWETLGDGGASVDARMGAARVLRRRYGEEERALMRVVDDPDVRVRVEAALEEHDDAEKHLETLGPLFRAR